MAVLTVGPLVALASPSEKRQSRRRPLVQIPAIAEIRVQSERVEVVDVSAGGLLICGRLRLRPGGRSQLEIIRVEGPLRLYGRVLRSEVAAISGQTIQYRSAIAFERPLDFLDQDSSEAALPSEAPLGVPPAGDLADVIVCYVADDKGLEQHLALNGW